MTYLMKCRKDSRGRVPLASCWTNSCSTYDFQISLVDWMRRRVKGCGLLNVGLIFEDQYRTSMVDDVLGDDTRRQRVHMVERAEALSYGVSSLNPKVGVLCCLTRSLDD